MDSLKPGEVIVAWFPEDGYACTLLDRKEAIKLFGSDVELETTKGACYVIFCEDSYEIKDSNYEEETAYSGQWVPESRSAVDPEADDVEVACTLRKGYVSYTMYNVEPGQMPIEKFIKEYGLPGEEEEEEEE